jgi:hypothetical protein
MSTRRCHAMQFILGIRVVHQSTVILILDGFPQVQDLIGL